MNAAMVIAASAGMLLPYQAAWVRDTSPLMAYEKSRRIGIDFADSYKSVRDRLTEGNSRDLWYSSADESAAYEYMLYAQRWALDVYKVALELVDEGEYFGDEEVRVMRITMPEVNGRQPRITALTSNPTRLRSKGGDIVMSELAFHQQAVKLVKAAGPSAMWGGQIRVISSHNGVDSVFNQRFVLPGKRRLDPETHGDPKPNDPVVSLHRTTLDEAIAQGLVERINEAQGTDWTREEYRAHVHSTLCLGDPATIAQECNCEPSEESSSYFPYELLRPTVDHALPPIRTDLIGFLADIHRFAADADAGIERCYAGADIGRRKDRFALAVLASVGGVRKPIGLLEYDRQKFSEMEGAIGAAMKLRNRRGAYLVKRCCIDETGIGMQLAERMCDRYRSRCEGVTFTTPVKADLANGARVAVEEITLRLPDDPGLLAQFNVIKKITTAARNVRYDAKQNETGHADAAWAVMLGVHADDVKPRRAAPVALAGGVP